MKLTIRHEWPMFECLCYDILYIYFCCFHLLHHFPKAPVYFQVERRERDNKRRLTILVIRFYLQNGSSRSNQARKNLIDRSKWHACRVMSITPQLREFQALSSINGIPIFPVILNPVNDSLGTHVSKEVNLGKLAQPLQQILKLSFNDSQLQAISVAVGSPKLKKDFELSLIQGPPGI